MREETTEWMEKLYKERTIPGPIADLGGSETSRQFKHLFPDYQVWDKRNNQDVDRVIDITQTLPREVVGSLGTLMCFDTLEHIWDYQTAIKNMGMLVKQNGLIILAMPFAFPFHDNGGDYWRFTSMALYRMFEQDFYIVDHGYYGAVVETGKWGSFRDTSYYIGQKT